MSLNTQDIFDTVALKYGATSDSEDFMRWFFMSLNRVAQDISSPRVGASIDVPDNLEEQIDADDHYFNVIIDGLHKYIQESGTWGHDDAGVLDAKYDKSLKEAHTYYASTIDITTFH